jgi:DNA primase large subunit
MSRDEEVKNVRLFDRRVVERNIKKGLTTRKDYEKYLKSLDDKTTNIASPEERIEDEPDDDDLLDDEDDDDDEVAASGPSSVTS